MTETVKAVCYKSKTLSNGEHPLMIRICKDGKKSIKALDYPLKRNNGTSKQTNLKPNAPIVT